MEPDGEDDPFVREFMKAATRPIDPDWKPCCNVLHHWPPGARCDELSEDELRK